MVPDLKFNILIIEDNEPDIYLVKAYLKKAQFKYFIHSCGYMSEAIEYLQENDVDLVLLDMGLPDACNNRSDNVSKLLKNRPELPIVVYSANADPDLAFECIEKGAQDYLVKGESEDWQILRSINFALKRREYNHNLILISQTDGLTGLSNRRHFMERLKHSISLAERKESMVGLLYADLDGFKAINDKYGHSIGDIFLKEFAYNISSVVRKIDTIARVGGDEFLIVLEDIASPLNATEIAKKILHKTNQAIEINGIILKVTVSIGISIYPLHSHNKDDLIKYADEAMYISKAAGKNQFHVHVDSTTEGMTSDVLDASITDKDTKH